jgi:hypothetical protein
MEYVAIIIKEKENVESATIYAHDDAEAYENARDWAAGLNLPRDDEVWLVVKTPDNSLKTSSIRLRPITIHQCPGS